MDDIKCYVLENGLVPSILEYNVMRLIHEMYGHEGIAKCTNEMKKILLVSKYEGQTLSIY